MFSVSLKEGTVKQITNEIGTHHAKLSPNKKYLIDKFSSLDIPAITQIIHLKKKKLVLLESKNPLAKYNIGKTEIRRRPGSSFGSSFGSSSSGSSGNSK